MLCPRCSKQDKEVEMKVEGAKWRCPVCTFSIDFPVKSLSYDELKREREELLYLNQKKNEYIGRLEEQLERLERERGVSFH